MKTATPLALAAFSALIALPAPAQESDASEALAAVQQTQAAGETTADAPPAAAGTEPDATAPSETEPDATATGANEPDPSATGDVETDPMIVSAADVTLADFKWLKRPLIVFADSPADPRYVQQMQFITDRLDALAERDVVVITDTDPAARSDVRRELRARDFMMVVMAKDGTIVTRKPAPWSVREISRSIDKLPLRQQEVRDRRETLR